MSAEDHSRAFRNFGQFFHKDCSGAAQFVNYVAVMDDFLPNVDGGPVQLKRDANHVNGTNDTSAEPTRFQ
jgi:hypothetical protein